MGHRFRHRGQRRDGGDRRRHLHRGGTSRPPTRRARSKLRARRMSACSWRQSPVERTRDRARSRRPAAAAARRLDAAQRRSRQLDAGHRRARDPARRWRTWSSRGGPAAVKSNAIVIAANGATNGVGMGQVKRVDAARLAAAATVRCRRGLDTSSPSPTASTNRRQSKAIVRPQRRCATTLSKAGRRALSHRRPALRALSLTPAAKLHSPTDSGRKRVVLVSRHMCESGYARRECLTRRPVRRRGGNPNPMICRIVGELKASGHRERGVTGEMQENLLAALADG